MWEIDDQTFSPTEFSGRVRLFPLPNLVMFPHVLQPLHVFERRYREMVEEALAGDRLIAMALLKPGWEHDYDGRPPIAPVACLGTIVTHHRQEDGKYNVMLLGLRRIRVVRELEPRRSFREAEVELFDDHYLTDDDEQARLQNQLFSAFKRLLPQLPVAGQQIDELLGCHVPLGMLTDIVGYAVNLDLGLKQRLLSELNVEPRARLLLEQLSKMPGSGVRRPHGLHAFPPQFSEN